MHPALTQIIHRPWPIPTRSWRWRQSWYDLLFAHWAVPATLLRPLVHRSLTIQEFEGTSYVGVVPFRMAGVMHRPLPDLPWVSAFPELNVRLYVERDGKPGVWFLSLDASNALAVWAARRFFHLPYWWATMQHRPHEDGFLFRSCRRRVKARARFEASYKGVGEPYFAQPGTLEAFLVERYCLYCCSPEGRLYRGEVHHAPWPLQPAQAEVKADELLATHGLPPLGPPTTLHFSRGVETVVWPLELLE